MERQITVREFINYLTDRKNPNISYSFDVIKDSRICSIGTSSDGFYVIETIELGDIKVPMWVDAPNKRKPQIGDKVKVIWKESSLYGQTGTIFGIEKNYLYLVGGFNGDNYFGRFHEEDLRLQRNEE